MAIFHSSASCCFQDQNMSLERPPSSSDGKTPMKLARAIFFWRGVIFVDGSHLMQIMRVEDEKMPHIGLRKTALAACNEIRVVAVRVWIAVAERIRGSLDVITYCPAPVDGSYVEVEDGLTREAVGDLVLIVAVELSPTVAVKKFTMVVIGCSPGFNI